MTVSQRNQRQLIIQFSLVLFVIFSLIGLTWANYRFVQNDTGMNEFTPRWAATRWFMVKGMSPYSQQTTTDVQTLVYGESNADNGGGRFLFPFFGIFLYAPFALIGDQNIARAIWMTVLEVSAIGVTVLGIIVNRWKPSKCLFAIVLLFPLFWYFSVRAILDGNIIVLCTLAITVVFLAIRTNHENFGGIMLALSMVNFQVLFPFFITVLIWAASDRRWSLFWSSIISLVFIIIAPMIFLQDWIMQFLRQVINSGDFGMTPGAVISYWLPGVGRQSAWILSFSTAALMIWEIVTMLGRDFRRFLWVGCLALNVTFLIGLPFYIEYYVLLLPVIILVLAVWDERWGLIGRILVVLSIVLLVFGVWLAAVNAGQKRISPEVDPSLVFFTPAFLLFGLYWIKWRAIRKPLVIKDDLVID